MPVDGHDIVKPLFRDGSLGHARKAHNLFWTDAERYSPRQTAPSHVVVIAYRFVKRGNPNGGWNTPVC
jgi:hypothetical protein